jgi:hypothetical protein
MSKPSLGMAVALAATATFDGCPQASVSVAAGQRRWYDYRLDQWYAMTSPGTCTLEVWLSQLPALKCRAVALSVAAAASHGKP